MNRRLRLAVIWLVLFIAMLVLVAIGQSYVIAIAVVVAWAGGTISEDTYYNVQQYLKDRKQSR